MPTYPKPHLFRLYATLCLIVECELLLTWLGLCDVVSHSTLLRGMLESARMPSRSAGCAGTKRAHVCGLTSARAVSRSSTPALTL